MHAARTLALAAAVMLAFPAAAPAQEDEPEVDEKELGWNGNVALGYAESRGNTDNLAVTSDLYVEYVTGGPWLYDAKLFGVNREEGGDTIEERYEARLSANYYWTDEDYFYGRLDWRKDNFGAVEEEWVPTVGYGRILLRTERHDLKGELGAGYRFATLADGTEEEGPALTAGVNYVWTLSDSADFFQNLLVQWTSDNTYLESETGLRTRIIGALGAKISYLVKSNSDVPDGTANSDFYTTIGLDYAF
jgi:putative salt-induced outer membrane protein